MSGLTSYWFHSGGVRTYITDFTEGVVRINIILISLRVVSGLTSYWFHSGGVRTYITDFIKGGVRINIILISLRGCQDLHHWFHWGRCQPPEKSWCQARCCWWCREWRRLGCRKRGTDHVPGTAGTHCGKPEVRAQQRVGDINHFPNDAIGNTETLESAHNLCDTLTYQMTPR